MSSIVTGTTAPHTLPAIRPSFFGIVRGEIFKVTRMWSIWLTLVLMLGIMCLPYLITSFVSRQADSLKQTPLHFFYNTVPLNLFVLRVFIGFFLIILTASVFGREYQLGTIRILLARGIGRLQLLFAKLLAVAVIALLVLAFCLLFSVVLQGIQMLLLEHNFNGLNALDSTFWHNIGIYLLTILISMGVTILLTVAMTALARSYVFGLSASLAFFPADNIGTAFMRIGYRLTGNAFWNNITAYFLGPNLNQMPAAIAPAYLENDGIPPLVSVDGTHTLLVALVYAAIFAVVAIVLTWKRDVQE